MKNSVYTFRIMIEKDGKSYHSFVPTLKGVHTCGKTITETKRNLNEAIQCHLQGLMKKGVYPTLEKGIHASFVDSEHSHVNL